MAPRYEPAAQKFAQSILPLQAPGGSTTFVVPSGIIDGGTPSDTFGPGAAVIDAGSP